MIVEKIDDNEHTMRMQRLAGEIDLVLGILEELSGRGIVLCAPRLTRMVPIQNLQEEVYRAFGIDPAALAREEEVRRRRHVAIHGRET